MQPLAQELIDTVKYAGLAALLLHVLRQMIRDFWFRNRQLKVSGDLDNEQRRRAMERDTKLADEQKGHTQVFIFVLHTPTGGLEKREQATFFRSTNLQRLIGMLMHKNSG